MTKYNSIKIIRPNGNIFIDLNSINYDKQILSDFFFEYEAHLVVWRPQRE